MQESAQALGMQQMPQNWLNVACYQAEPWTKRQAVKSGQISGGSELIQWFSPLLLYLQHASGCSEETSVPFAALE